MAGEMLLAARGLGWPACWRPGRGGGSSRRSRPRAHVAGAL